MNYDKINKDVAFRESDHKYFNVKDPSIKYTSVTTLLNDYKEPFDGELMSRYKALEALATEEDFKKVKGEILSSRRVDLFSMWCHTTNVNEALLEVTARELRKDWTKTKDDACEVGSAYHLERELDWYDNSGVLLKKRVPVVQGMFDCVKHDFSLNREKAIIPEYLVYYSCPDKMVHLAGQMDLLIKDGNDIYILDYKTNAKGIDKPAYFNRATKQTKKLYYPLNNLDDTKLNIYTMQLSIYAWMLEKINPEFNIKLLKLLHVDRDGVETDYEVPYLKEEVTRVIKHKKHLIRNELIRKGKVNV